MIYGLDSMIYGLGPMIYGLGPMIYGMDSMIYGLDSMIYGLGSMIYGLGSMIWACTHYVVNKGCILEWLSVVQINKSLYDMSYSCFKRLDCSSQCGCVFNLH